MLQQLNLMGMTKICLYGASGHGKVIKDIVISCGRIVEVFIDDNPVSKFLDDTSVLTSEKIELFKANDFVISIGNNKTRKNISKKINCNFIKLIHPSAIISSTVSIDIGTVVMPSVVINSDTYIGQHVIVNTNAVIEHDCKIEDFVHISPNATITGGVSIGEGTHIGGGAIIIPGIKIGKWVTVGAGAVIIKNIPDYATVVGNPGKIIKHKEKNG